MIDKYNKYWRDIPLLYSFAFILDLRAKMKGFSRVLRRLGSLTSTSYETYQLATRARLADVYNKYEKKFGSVRLRRTSLLTCLIRKGLLGMRFMMMMKVIVLQVVSILYLVLLICLDIPLQLSCCMLQVLLIIILLNWFPTWTVTLLAS